MFEDKLQLPEEPGLFQAPITKSAKNRRVYSEARKSLAVLPSTRSLPRSGDSSEDLGPGPENASTRWRQASTAILKGIRSTNTVESTAGLLKYFSVTKELNKEQLLHEKFCHLVAGGSAAVVRTEKSEKPTRPRLKSKVHSGVAGIC